MKLTWSLWVCAGLAVGGCSVKSSAKANFGGDNKVPEPEATEPEATEPAPAPDKTRIVSKAKKYTDQQGNEVTFEGGDAAFADKVVGFKKGKPFTGQETEQNPDATMGPPNFSEVGDGSMLSMGCGGALTVGFEDNSLVDQEGPDLHVFEVGPQIEAFKVEISTDGQKWLVVGTVEGQPAQVDISAVAEAGVEYKFVRITDQRKGCKGDWPGADIDALGTLSDSAAGDAGGGADGDAPADDAGDDAGEDAE